MTQSTVNLLLGTLLGAVLGYVANRISGRVSRHADEKKDFRYLQDKIEELQNRLEQLRELIASLPAYGKTLEPKAGIEGKIIHAFERASEAARKGLSSEEKTVQIYDFEVGWSLLFEEWIANSEETLRDFTLSSHGLLSFGKYDFAAYPSMIESFLTLAGDHRHRVRVMILCDSDEYTSDQCNMAAEGYFEGMLSIRFPQLKLKQRMERLLAWRKAATIDSDEEVEVRLISKRFALKFVNVNQDVIEHPFNVYGASAVSRSIVAPGLRDRPVPHLEILLHKRDIKLHKEVFDCLWKEALVFHQGLVAATSDEDLEKLGKTGELFRRWSLL